MRKNNRAGRKNGVIPDGAGAEYGYIRCQPNPFSNYNIAPRFRPVFLAEFFPFVEIMLCGKKRNIVTGKRPGTYGNRAGAGVK
ncbi:hypothetical protein [Oscillibacter ruminantium]